MIRSTCEYKVHHGGLYGDGMCGILSSCPACGGCEVHCNGDDCPETYELIVEYVRIGTLKPGDGFRTILTDAFGIVRDVFGPYHYPQGMKVDLTYPEDFSLNQFVQKNVHRNVLVIKEPL